MLEKLRMEVIYFLRLLMELYIDRKILFVYGFYWFIGGLFCKGFIEVFWD